MKCRVVVGLFLVQALVALVLAPVAAQADLIQATGKLTALGNTAPITSNFIIFSATETVTANVEFSGTIGTNHLGGPGAHWELDLTATGFTLRTNCLNFGGTGDECEYPNGLQLSLTGMIFSPPAALVDITVLSPSLEDFLLVSGTPGVTPSSLLINFQAFQKSSSGIEEPNEEIELETVFEAQFVTREVVVATPLPGTLVLLALSGLGAAALAVYRARA